MADTRTFLTRTIEQIKRFAHNPSATRAVTETQLLEDIRRAHVGVYEDLAAAMGPEAQFFYSLHTLTLTEDQEWASLPATFRKFIHLVKRDDTGKIILDRRKHTPGTLNDRIGVAMTPDLRRMRFCPVVTGQEAGDWELCFEAGPIELHYGAPGKYLSVTGATFTNSTKTLTKVGAFTGYTYKSGDIIKITAGAGVSVGRYAVASRVSDDAITLASDIGGSDPSDVAGDIYKVDRLILAASPTKGQLYAVDDYYVGARAYVVSGFGIEQVTTFTGYTGSSKEGVLLEDWAEVPDDASVYEIRPMLPGRPDEFDEIIAWRAALKYRRIRGDDPPGEGAALREIKHIRSEMLRRMDVNTDKAPSIRRSRPARSQAIWNR